MSAATSSPLGSQSHNVRAIGYWARESTRSTRPTSTRRYAIEVEKLEDIQDVVVTTTNGMPVYVQQIAKVVDRLPAAAGDRRPSEATVKRTTSSRASS